MTTKRKLLIPRPGDLYVSIRSSFMGGRWLFVPYSWSFAKYDEICRVGADAYERLHMKGETFLPGEEIELLEHIMKVEEEKFKFRKLFSGFNRGLYVPRGKTFFLTSTEHFDLSKLHPSAFPDELSGWTDPNTYFFMLKGLIDGEHYTLGSICRTWDGGFKSAQKMLNEQFTLNFARVDPPRKKQNRKRFANVNEEENSREEEEPLISLNKNNHLDDFPGLEHEGLEEND